MLPSTIPPHKQDLAALAEALSQLPAYVRLGGGGGGGAFEGEGEEDDDDDDDDDDAGPIDPAYTVRTSA
jgi:hypothetical protein